MHGSKWFGCSEPALLDLFPSDWTLNTGAQKLFIDLPEPRRTFDPPLLRASIASSELPDASTCSGTRPAGGRAFGLPAAVNRGAGRQKKGQAKASNNGNQLRLDSV